MKTDKELDFLEGQIPILALGAAQKAYVDTLSEGNSVLESINGELFKIYPDGRKEFVKKIDHDIKFDINQKIYLK